MSKKMQPWRLKNSAVISVSVGGVVLVVCAALSTAILAGVPFYLAVGIVLVVVFSVGLPIGAVVGAVRRNPEVWGARQDVTAGVRHSRVFSIVGRLLPTEVRDEYCEEWGAWIADLRGDGTPRFRRWLELLSIVLIAVPRHAVGLRVAAARRAVDR